MDLAQFLWGCERNLFKERGQNVQAPGYWKWIKQESMLRIASRSEQDNLIFSERVDVYVELSQALDIVAGLL